MSLDLKPCEHAMTSCFQTTEVLSQLHFDRTRAAAATAAFRRYLEPGASVSFVSKSLQTAYHPQLFLA
jgi:hypothetical protein